LNPETLRCLQRQVGNRGIARWLARDTLDETPPPARSITSDANWDVADRIDKLRKLDNKALVNERKNATNQLLNFELSKSKTDELRLDLYAVEWVAKERELGGLAPSPQFGARIDVERAIAHTGSFEDAIIEVSKSDKFLQSSEYRDEIKALYNEMEDFSTRFEMQATHQTRQLLKASWQGIRKVLESFGLPPDIVIREAGQNSDKDVIEHTMSLPHLKGDWAKTYAGKVDARIGLAADVLDLETKQKAVVQIEERIKQMEGAIAHPENVSPQSMDEPEKELQTLRPQLAEATRELQTMWIEAERRHAVLAQYRTGEELAHVGFGNLEHMVDLGRGDDGDSTMRSILEGLVPKVANIKSADNMIAQGKPSALTLAPIVALIRGYMFVAPGSIRDGKVNDMVKHAKGHGWVRWVIEAVLFAFAMITLLPSAGASLALPASAAGVMYGMYSALDEYVKYDQDKTLINTNIDRARSLSDAEPSLTGFVVSLVSVGLDALPLLHAFHQAVALRRLGLGGKEVTDLVNALNKLGKDHNLGELGTDVYNTAKAERTAAQGVKPPTETPPTPKPPKPKPEPKPPKPKPEPKPPKPKPEPKPPKPKPEPKPPKPKPEPAPSEPAPKETSEPPGKKPPATGAAPRAFKSAGEVYRAVADALTALKGRAPNLPEDWHLVLKALKASDSPEAKRVAELLPTVMDGLQDPHLYAEVLSEAWVRAGRGGNINEALEQMALEARSASGGSLPVVRIKSQAPGQGLLRAKDFFQRYASKPGYFIDIPLAGGDHGAMSHLLQDLVVDRALKNAKAGLASPEFRALLADVKSVVTKDAYQTTKALSFIDKEGEREVSMTTGDFIWRMTYDLYETPGRMPMPEELGKALQKLVGLQ
jgi:hypothetical protein